MSVIKRDRIRLTQELKDKLSDRYENDLEEFFTVLDMSFEDILDELSPYVETCLTFGDFDID